MPNLTQSKALAANLSQPSARHGLYVSNGQLNDSEKKYYCSHCVSNTEFVPLQW